MKTPKVNKHSTDNIRMEISSLQSSYADGASGIRSQQVMTEISVAVMKQQQEQQDRFASAIIAMINETPSPSIEGNGQLFDISF